MNRNYFVLVFLLYLAMALVCTSPVIFNLTKPLGPPEDNQTFIWNIWWFKYAIFNLHTSPFVTNYLFYPQGASLYFHTFSPLNNLTALLLEPVFGLIVTYNVLLLLTLIISALGAFYLLKYLKLSDSAAFIGGIIYSFNPFHLAHLSHHLNISSIHLIPLLIFFSLKYLDTGKLKYLVISSIILAANFYYDSYIFLFSSILLGFLPFFTTEPNDKQRFGKYIKTASIFALGIIMISPLLIPMIAEILRGPFETFIGHDIYVVDLAGFFFPHRSHWTGSSPINYLVNLSYKGISWESAAFLGYLVLPMAIWAAIKIKIKLKWYAITIGLVGPILSLGTAPHIFGRTIPFIKLPIFLLEKIPGLNAARSPARFIFLSYFSLSVLTAFAAEHFFGYLKSHHRKWVCIFGAALLSLGIMADFWSIPFESSNIPIPGFFEKLRNEKGNYAILNLPQPYLGNRRYMYYQTIHQKPICNGQLARSGDKYFLDWQNIPLTTDFLKSKNIKYIALYSEFLESQEYNKLKQRYSRDFAFISEEWGVSLFRIY